MRLTFLGFLAIIGMTCSAGTALFANSEDTGNMRICTMEYAPVCGIDGITYGNSCMAGDMEISHQGECKTSEKIAELESQLPNNIVDAIDSYILKYENALKNLSPKEQNMRHNEVVQRSLKATERISENYSSPLREVMLEMIELLRLRITEMMK